MKELAFENAQFGGIRREVCNLLRKAILDGLYEPGEQIYEAEIAKQLRLSRGPVREALLQLEKESLIQSVFNKGWFVIDLTPQQLAEITSLRVVLEVLALKLARDKMNKRGLKTLTRIQDSMLSLFEKQEYSEAVQRDFDFHKEIWRLAGNEVLEETAKRVTTPYFAFLKMSKVSAGFRIETFHESLQNHNVILDYLAGRTDESAENCIRDHFAPLSDPGWRVLLDAIHAEERGAKQ